MSTSHTLIKFGPVELFADERSSRVAIGISHESVVHDMDTGAIFTSEHLLEIIINLLKVTSYISDEPEEIVQQLLAAINKDSYLKSMPLE